MDKCGRCGQTLTKDNWLKCWREGRNGRGKLYLCNTCHAGDVRKQRAGYKLKVVSHYSNETNACADPYHLHLTNDPFLTDMRVLSIDHIKGGGTRHRRKIPRGQGFYRWLIEQGYPEGYQVLCENCQFVKRRENNESH